MKLLQFKSIILTALILFLAGSCKKDDPAPEPVAGFEVNFTEALVGETIVFTNTSQHADSYLWNFGDGATATEADPKHVYEEAGSYSVTLEAKGAGGSDVDSKKIVISHPRPIAAFEVDKTEAEAPATIKFTNQSRNAATYKWDFGDGATSTEKDPSHKYEQSGQYTVKLTVSGEGGSDEDSKVINIITPPPIVAFNIDKSEAEAPATIRFTNQSKNATSFQWDFGDGSTSAAKNPSHEYQKPGRYTVTLTAMGERGSEETSRSIRLLAAIFPGEGVRGIEIGDNWASIRSEFSGKTFEYFSALTRSGDWVHIIEPMGTGMLFAFVNRSPQVNAGDRVLLIGIAAPFPGLTEEGIGIGTRLSEVRTAYGAPEEHDLENMSYKYSSRGIDFNYDGSPRAVDLIFLYTPEEGISSGTQPDVLNALKKKALETF